MRSVREPLRRAGVLLVATSFAMTPLMLTASAQASTPGTTVDFGFVGDMPYATDFTSTVMTAWANDVNASGAQFVAHTGDFKGGNDACSDARMTTTVGYYNLLHVPFWATPGDNDWTDCHRNTNGSTASKPDGGDSNGTGFDPLERLAQVRAMYYNANPHQTNVGGGTPIALNTQGDSTVAAERPYVENTYFTKDCVTFGDIHSVSSANGLLTPTQGSAIKSSSSNYINEHVTAGDYTALQSARNNEVAARTAADIAWIDKIFDAAQADPNNEAIFLMMQAEPALYDDQPAASGAYTQPTTDPYGATETPIWGNDVVSGHDEFWDIRKEIYVRAQAYGKPLIIAHGDQHVYTVTPSYLNMDQADKGSNPSTGAPIATGLPNLPALPNVARLENFGSNGATTSGAKNWIEVQATCGTPNVFAQRPRTVGTSPGAFQAMSFSGPGTSLREAPLAAVLVLAGIGVGGGLLLARRHPAVRG